MSIADNECLLVKLRGVVFGLAVMSLASTPALAQSIVGAEKAIDSLVQAGVLGSISVILIVAVVYLQLRLDRLQDKHRAEILELAKTQSSILSEHCLLQKQQNELLARMNDKLDRV